jgi:hypothetical protein
MKRLYTNFLLFLLTPILIFAEENATGSISGTVRSSMNAKPLTRVTVQVVGTKIGGFTDKNGRFKIKNVPVGRQSIQFSYIGFQKFVKTDVNIIKDKTTDFDINLVEAFSETEEITVKAQYFVKLVDAATGTQSFSSEDISNAPGVQEDVIRAVQLLPGVNQSGPGRNDLIVRGGAPFENLYIIDGIEVPSINHFSSQGSTGGPVSIVNIDFIEDVQFSAGGFGVRYGDKTASMTNIKMRSGNKEEFRGRLDLSATGVDGSIEGPIGTENKGSYFISARRSYLDFLFSMLGFSFIPQYWDFQGKIDYQVTDNDIIKVIAFGVLDDLKVNNDDEEDKYNNSSIPVQDQKQYIFGATWKHLFEKGYSEVILSRSFTQFETYQKDSNLVDIFRNNSREGEIGLKSELFYYLNNHCELVFGNNFKLGSTMDYDIKIPGYIRLDNDGVPQSLLVDSTFSTYKNASYAYISTAFGNHRVTAGIRGDYFSITEDKYFLSPRISMYYNIDEQNMLIGSVGRYYQSPTNIWLVGDPNQKLNPIKADQIVAGYAYTPLKDLKMQVEFYYKWYDNYPARLYRPQAVLSPSGFDNVKNDIPFGLEPLIATGTGVSRGMEFFVQKKMSDIPLWGLFSITLSESNFTSIDGIERPGVFDSRLMVNLSLGYRFNENWELSGKFRLATGTPTTPYDENGKIDFTRYNEGTRFPTNHSLDMRLDKRWRFGSSMLTTYIDIQNIYDQANSFSKTWDERKKEEVFQTGIGFLPSIGIRYEF